jgi:hypothetical protein
LALLICPAPDSHLRLGVCDKISVREYRCRGFERGNYARSVLGLAE